jgi:hypothetical protein
MRSWPRLRTATWRTNQLRQVVACVLDITDWVPGNPHDAHGLFAHDHADCPIRRKEEEDRRAKIVAMEEAQLAAEEKYKDKADEAEQKTKKLKKLWKKFQEVNAEVEDMYKEFQREKVCWDRSPAYKQGVILLRLGL